MNSTRVRGSDGCLLSAKAIVSNQLQANCENTVGFINRSEKRQKFQLEGRLCLLISRSAARSNKMFLYKRKANEAFDC